MVSCGGVRAAGLKFEPSLGPAPRRRATNFSEAESVEVARHSCAPTEVRERVLARRGAQPASQGFVAEQSIQGLVDRPLVVATAEEPRLAVQNGVGRAAFDAGD